MKKPRRNYTPEEKVAILRRHLVEKETVSSLCGGFQLRPTVFYRWLKEFFENGAAAKWQPRGMQPTYHSRAIRTQHRGSDSRALRGSSRQLFDGLLQKLSKVKVASTAE